MPDHAWKDWPESCPECGGDLQVFSADPRDGWAWDNDEVRCIDPECGITGKIRAYEEDDCHAVFPDWAADELEGRAGTLIHSGGSAQSVQSRQDAEHG